MIFPKSLRHYAIDQIVAVAKEQSTDEAREKLMRQVNEIAIGPSVYGRLVFRFIAIGLGLVAVLVVVFSFALLLSKRTVDSAFYTLGSAAVGALGGVFAPHGDGATTTTSTGKETAEAQTHVDPGQAGSNQPGK
jgi:hypothetical protein